MHLDCFVVIGIEAPVLANQRWGATCHDVMNYEVIDIKKGSQYHSITVSPRTVSSPCRCRSHVCWQEMLHVTDVTGS
jgi:hypothetical protein